MSGPATHIVDGARAAAAGWRDLFDLSRASAWWPLIVAFAVGAYDAERSVQPALVVGILYLSVPFGLLRHGFAMLEGDGPPPIPADALRLAIAATALPFLVILVVLGGPVVGVAALAMVALAWLLADRRVALADRPGLDVAAVGALPALAAVMGLALGDRPVADLPWLAIAAVFLWATGLAALASIQGAGPSDEVVEARGTVAALGARGTAWLALVDLGMAAVLTALLGPLGILAALGVATYLLLPPMVLSTTIGSSADTARELPGLRRLVGAWLGILLLQHWGVVDWRPFMVVVVGATILVGWALVNVLATRVTTNRRPVASGGPDDDQAPSVAIVVPCLDAAVHLRASLAALRSQTYADFTILLVDHGSTDGTVEEAGAWLGEDGVIVAPPTPEAWAGKAWASQVGIERTTSDLILIIDPDTVLVPVALRHLVEHLEARRVDLLSGIPRFDMPTVGERAGVPGFAMLLLGFVPIWWSALSGGHPSRTAFASGRLLLVRREAYLASGGLAATPGTTRDGRALAKTLARTGRRLATVHLADLAASRPVRDVDDTVAAWRRMTGARDVPIAVTLAVIVLQAWAYLVPLVAAPAAIISDQGLGGIGLALVPLGLLVTMRFALALTQRQPLTSILWHPVTILVALAGQAAGLGDHVVRRRT